LPKAKFKFAIDLDGVLADTAKSLCRILNSRYSTAYTPEVFDRWNAWEVAQISRDEFLRTLDEAWFDWRTMPAIESELASKVLRLTKFGTIDIVTGRSEVTVPFAREWLQLQGITYTNFVRTASVNAKADLDYDIFIDDSEFLMSLIASRLIGVGILYTQPWNRSAKNMPRIFRANSWEEIPRLITRIEGQNAGKP